MANVLKNPQHKAQLGYSGFDMSQLIKFSSTVGELRPIYWDFLDPGDRVSLNHVLKTRTMEINSAAMMSVDEHIEWFFVPLNQIYTIFGDWFYGIQDFKSSLFSVTGVSDVLPHFSPATLQQYASHRYVDVYFHELGSTAIRLFEDFNIPVGPMLRGKMPMALCPLLACAYQKIYFDYYRISDREPNDPSCYSLDDYYQNPSDLDINDFSRFFTLRYRPWAKDFYTCTQISPVMAVAGKSAFPGTAAGAGDGLVKTFNQWLSNVSFATYTPNGSPSNGSNETSETYITNVGAFSVNTNPGLINQISPVGIRTQFAVEKLLEITRRAGKHYDKQTLAHFGADVPTGIAGEVMFLGKSTQTLQIGDVIATAASESNALGQVGGKGYGYGEGNEIRFTAPAHGILMAIYSAEPKADYQVTGYDKLNALINRSDWRYPEYDNTGMQPLFNYQSYLKDVDDEEVATNVSIAGWQHRYMERKLKYNKVQNAFMRTMKYWTPQRIFVGGQSEHQLDRYSRYLINPFYLDPVMVVAYGFDEDEVDSQGNALPLFWRDPLIHEIYFDVKKSSTMSTYGLPSL